MGVEVQTNSPITSRNINEFITRKTDNLLSQEKQDKEKSKVTFKIWDNILHTIIKNYRKYYSNRRGLFRNISNCLKNCFIEITQHINSWRSKRALWSGPCCTFRPKMPNHCTKNRQFVKYLKKNCFLGPKDSKIDISKTINIILKKNTCPFLSSIEREEKFSAQSKI